MNTREKAPSRWVSTSRAVASRVRSGSPASRAVTSAVSLVPSGPSAAAAPSPWRWRTSARSEAVLVRLPLWARDTVPEAVSPRVGWALSQLLAPVVE